MNFCCYNEYIFCDYAGAIINTLVLIERERSKSAIATKTVYFISIPWNLLITLNRSL